MKIIATSSITSNGTEGIREERHVEGSQGCPINPSIRIYLRGLNTHQILTNLLRIGYQMPTVGRRTVALSGIFKHVGESEIC